MKKLLNCSATLITIALFSCGVGSLWGGTITGNSSGVFINPVAGPDNPSMVVNGVGTGAFSWGSGTDPSSLSYLNVPFAGVPFEAPFMIGRLTYHNGLIPIQTGANGVSLELTLDLTLPSFVSSTFIYPMQLINTPNTTDPIASADYVILSTFPHTTFSIGGTVYTLTLGFVNLQGGGFLQAGNQFHVLEGGSATADLMATVTTDVSGVPDAASTLGLLSSAILCLAAARRKLAR